MLFSQILSSMTRSGESWHVDVPEDWLQGRSAFGGLQAALAARAMRELLPGVPLRTVQATFMAPVPAGPLQVSAQVLRAGRSATHVQARLHDGAQTLCLVLGIFGAARESSVRIALTRPALADTQPREFPYIEGLSPGFTRHFAIRWLRGGMPYTGASDAENVLELDLRDEGSAGEAQVLAIADVIPPIALSHLRKPAAGSSMTWMLEFLTDRLDGLPLNRWRMDARLVAAADGYTSQSGVLWGPDGTAVALSRQNMVVFA